MQDQGRKWQRSLLYVFANLQSLACVPFLIGMWKLYKVCMFWCSKCKKSPTEVESKAANECGDGLTPLEAKAHQFLLSQGLNLSPTQLKFLSSRTSTFEGAMNYFFDNMALVLVAGATKPEDIGVTTLDGLSVMGARLDSALRDQQVKLTSSQLRFLESRSSTVEGAMNYFFDNTALVMDVEKAIDEDTAVGPPIGLDGLSALEGQVYAALRDQQVELTRSQLRFLASRSSTFEGAMNYYFDNTGLVMAAVDEEQSNASEGRSTTGMDKRVRQAGEEGRSESKSEHGAEAGAGAESVLCPRCEQSVPSTFAHAMSCARRHQLCYPCLLEHVRGCLRRSVPPHCPCRLTREEKGTGEGAGEEEGGGGGPTSPVLPTPPSPSASLLWVWLGRSFCCRPLHDHKGLAPPATHCVPPPMVDFCDEPMCEMDVGMFLGSSLLKGIIGGGEFAQLRVEAKEFYEQSKERSRRGQQQQQQEQQQELERQARLLSAQLEDARRQAKGRDWLTPPRAGDPAGVIVREIARTSPTITNQVLSRELNEYNMACAQFARLAQKMPSAVTQVDAIEYEDGCPVQQQFAQKKRELEAAGRPVDEILIFHGTASANLQAIVQGGFKVGGIDPGVPIANGAAYGNGVYTATGPATPIIYARGSNRVIIAKALPGLSLQQQRQSGSCDSWRPNGDWVIFARGSQLLPLYVVHFNN